MNLMYAQTISDILHQYQLYLESKNIQDTVKLAALGKLLNQLTNLIDTHVRHTVDWYEVSKKLNHPIDTYQRVVLDNGQIVMESNDSNAFRFTLTAELSGIHLSVQFNQAEKIKKSIKKHSDDISNDEFLEKFEEHYCRNSEALLGCVDHSLFTHTFRHLQRHGIEQRDAALERIRILSEIIANQDQNQFNLNPRQNRDARANHQDILARLFSHVGRLNAEYLASYQEFRNILPSSSNSLEDVYQQQLIQLAEAVTPFLPEMRANALRDALQILPRFLSDVVPTDWDRVDIISNIEELNRHQPLPIISFVRPYILCWPHQPALDGSNIPQNIRMENNLPNIPIDMQIMMFIKQLRSLINCFKSAYIQTRFLAYAISQMNDISSHDGDKFFTNLQTLMMETQRRTTELLQDHGQHVNQQNRALEDLRRDCGAFANSQEFVAINHSEQELTFSLDEIKYPATPTRADITRAREVLNRFKQAYQIYQSGFQALHRRQNELLIHILEQFAHLGTFENEMIQQALREMPSHQRIASLFVAEYIHHQFHSHVAEIMHHQEELPNLIESINFTSHVVDDFERTLQFCESRLSHEQSASGGNRSRMFSPSSNDSDDLPPGVKGKEPEDDPKDRKGKRHR